MPSNPMISTEQVGRPSVSARILTMVDKELLGLRVRHGLDAAEVGVATGLREPVDRRTHLLLAEFRRPGGIVRLN